MRRPRKSKKYGFTGCCESEKRLFVRRFGKRLAKTSLPMKAPSAFVFALIVSSSAGVGAVQAQTEKTVQGQYGPLPYISHAEFEDISMGGRTASGTSITGTERASSERGVKFNDLLTIESVKEVTRRFGEPESTDYKKFPEEDFYIKYESTFVYKGAKFYYKKVSNKIKLETMVITSRDLFLEVGGIQLRPGMSPDALSAPVRQAMDDGVSVLRIVGPDATEKGDLEQAVRQTRTKISIELNEDRDSVRRVIFNQLVI
jgi:hypothetical protein